VPQGLLRTGRGVGVTTRTAARTVRGLLHEPLRIPRVHHLETACVAVATSRSLKQLLAELDQVLAEPLPSESGWRLEVLVSVLYHHADATLTLTEDLRGRIKAAQTTAGQARPHRWGRP